MQNPKERAAIVSNISNASLVIGKLIIGFASGSISIVSEAVHSGIDLIASMIAYISIKKANKPADDDHLYGHGKFEDMSGLAEGILIFIAAGWIIYEATEKILHPKNKIEFIELGIVLMFFSALLNWFVSIYLYKVAKQHDSIALEADALHLRTDVYTSFGVFAGLIMIKLFNLPLLDPIIAIIVAMIIIHISRELILRSYKNLSDYRLPKSVLDRIVEIITNHKAGYIEFHKLRGRKSGSEQHIDFHLILDKNLDLGNCHKFCDQIEEDIKNEFPNAEIIIHIEPND